MSTERFMRERGPAPKLKKGPNGRNLCRWCQTEVPPSRKTFCSAKCVVEWRLRTDAGFVRAQVFARDHGVCALCGLDTEELRRTLIGIWHQSPEAAHVNAYIHGFGNAFKHVRLRWGHSPKPRSLWAADHIVPVAEGGGLCGISNYRTLCTPCHQRETKALAGRRAKQRKSKT